MGSDLTDRPKGVSDERMNELFHGPLEDFTAARNELAKSLRSEGGTEAADWVKGLKKPSRAAWLANQLAVRKPKDVRRLLEVGQELRAAQEEMLSGAADREKLREAGARERETVDSLLETAGAIGREHGVGSQILDRVGETLRAATSDPEVAEAIEKGWLTREQRASGIGLVGGAMPKAPARGRKKDEREDAERRTRQQQAKRRKEAERKLATAEKRLEREQAKLAKARDAVEDAEQAVHKAELDAHAARRTLEEI
jgi:DNA repair exonuclease SbcCD ATPase subunit